MNRSLLGLLLGLVAAIGVLTASPTHALAVSYCDPLGPGTGQMGKVDAGSYGAANIRTSPNGAILCLAVNGTEVIMTSETANSPTPGLSGVWDKVYFGYTLQTGWIVSESVDSVQQPPPSTPAPASAPPSTPPNFSSFDPSQSRYWTVCGQNAQCQQSIGQLWAAAVGSVRGDFADYANQVSGYNIGDLQRGMRSLTREFELHKEKIVDFFNSGDSEQTIDHWLQEMATWRGQAQINSELLRVKGVPEGEIPPIPEF
jgi:hypothetical protein